MAEKPDYGKMPGNQEPNTPRYDESEHQGKRGKHPSGDEHRWGHEKGNQSPNTPEVNESEKD